MKKMVLALVFAALLCVLSVPAAAQSNSCLNTTTWWIVPDGPLPIGWFVYSSYPGTFAILIASWKSSCPPADAPPEGCTGGGCSGGGSPGSPPAGNPTAGRPINLATGNTYIQQTDVKIPGLSGGLTLTRTWNSMWPATQSTYQIGPFGPNWSLNFEERIFVGSDQYIKYARGDGSFWSFGSNGLWSWSVAAPANASATLVQGTTNWTLTFQNGEQRVFNIATGQLVSIIDRNGNTTQLSYDSLNRLVTVTDPASRHLYFGYGSAIYLVTSVTSDFGESVSYSYDSQGRLNQVTEPDGSTLSFQYDSNSFISAVVDSHGKILESHTYDSSGRGLTSSRANGAESLTISYQ
jgi:YD repeat-containing protein